MPAVLAVLVASGIGLAWPGDLRVVSSPRSGSAAEASVVVVVAPTSAAPTTAAQPTESMTGLGPGASSAESGAVSAPSETSSAPPQSAAIDGSAGTSPAPASSTPASSAPPVLAAIVDLRDDPVRRRVQTWEPPADPSLLEGYRWPLPKGLITDPFGPSPWGSRVVNGQLFHDGLDIATVCGDRIVAAHDGVVLAAGRKFDEKIGWVGDLGPYEARLDAKKLWWTLPITVVIDDGNGYRSIYAHFWQVVVKAGQHVAAGQLLGYEGATGRATGCHLHYGLFAPHETALFAIEPDVVKRMLVPPYQIARIDPLLVLPRRPGDEEPTGLPDPSAGHDLGG